MRDIGSLFGWLMTAGLFLTLLNYPIKAIYRSTIAPLPRKSKTKTVYGRIQKVIVTNHRFFALFATAMLATHVIIQLVYRWLSWTGLAAAILMVINGFLGGYGHFGDILPPLNPEGFEVGASRSMGATAQVSTS